MRKSSSTERRKWREHSNVSQSMATASRFSPPPPFSLHPSLLLRSPAKPYCVPRPRSRILRSPYPRRSSDLRARYRFSGGELTEFSPDGEDPGPARFEGAVSLFNGGDYHECHDVLEDLWNGAEEPIRTLVHGILQCAVGLYHLFNQNHRGAMMELGEGLCKLRKMDFESGPFLQFEQEISAALEFLYHTQMELAACTDDFCLTMDGSESSYQLLGSFAAGQQLYSIDTDPDGVSYIIFCPVPNYGCSDKTSRVKVPTLDATEEHLIACKYTC